LAQPGPALRLSGLSLAGSYQLDSVTMFAQPGLTGTHGVELATSDGDSRSVTVRGSIFDNFAFDTYTSYATAGGSPTSSITINTTRLDAGSAQYGNTGGPRPPVFSGSRITSDPSFVNGPTGDFRLKRGSAMIDRGAWSVTLPPGRGTLDLRGDIRLSDGNQDNVKTTDMGAYEFQGGPRQLSPTGVPTSVLGSMRVASKATCDPGAWVYHRRIGSNLCMVSRNAPHQWPGQALLPHTQGRLQEAAALPGHLYVSRHGDQVAVGGTQGCQSLRGDIDAPQQQLTCMPHNCSRAGYENQLPTRLPRTLPAATSLGRCTSE